MNVKLNMIKNKQPPPPVPAVLLLVVEQNAICRWWNWVLPLFGKGYRQLLDQL